MLARAIEVISIFNPLISILNHYGGGAVGDTDDGAGSECPVGADSGSDLDAGFPPGPRNCSKAALSCSGLGVEEPGLVI